MEEPGAVASVRIERRAGTDGATDDSEAARSAVAEHHALQRAAKWTVRAAVLKARGEGAVQQLGGGKPALELRDLKLAVEGSRCAQSTQDGAVVQHCALCR
eukprot:1668063-Prymnesium_polylepis.1